MSRFLRKLSFTVYKQFTLLWVIFTIILLVFFSYLNWCRSLNSSYKLANDIAVKMGNHIDGFIDEIFQEVNNIPISRQNNIDCPKNLYPRLQRILVNNPAISGFTIRDKDFKLVCSTLPDHSVINAPIYKSEAILGPLKNPIFDKPIFAIQKKIGDYYIKVIIVSSVFENMLETSESSVQKVLLYDQSKDNYILKIEHPHKTSWIGDKLIQAQTALSSQNTSASAKLHSIDGIIIMVVSSRQTMLNSLWYNQILLSVNILIISCLIYWLLKSFIHHHYSLHGAIKQAIKKKQFRPMYQPIYNVHLETHSGVEVLLRWFHDNDQVIMPDFFIEEAEDTGLIIPITLQIIEIAFKETDNILSANPHFHLSFNLTAQHFTHPTFFNKFFHLMEQYSISAKQILIEITERELLDENNEAYNQKMQMLRDAGYSLAVDDYGTGHASISYLQHFPFNYLKIDKLFINAIGTKAITESLNDAIISLAKKINLIIIAEGVETQEQVDYLKKNGVYLLQGWYYSKAISIEQLNKLLQGEKK